MSRRDDKKNLKRLAVGSGLAAALGYAAGVLTAPKSGKQTRKDLKNAADTSLAAGEKELKYLHTELGQIIDETKVSGLKLTKKAQGELDDLVAKAQDSKDKAREILSAVHEGDADDEDLKKAIKHATRALNNLRAYLKK